jgi:hydrogenase nickel incorporation protein HypA/HybF
MHEIGIAQEIVAIASEEAGGAAVARVVVEVGALAAVVPDALQFCFELVCEGTPLAGASLEISSVPARGRCRSCGQEGAFESPWARCGCGGTEMVWLSGDELRVTRMEVR